ncbi:MAG: hypothetical protein GDYSWBUE_001175 [Candidatus Fervidibacterota bacterium]
MGIRGMPPTRRALRGRVRIRWGTMASFLTLGLALYLVGVSNDSEPAHFISRILLFVPLVSFMLGLVNMSGVTCRLQYPKLRLWEGQNADLHLKLTNHGSLSKLNFLFHITILNKTLNFGQSSVWFIPSIAGEQSADAVVSIQGLKRGENKIERFTLACDSPLGIFSFEREYGCDGSCVVYPRLLCEPEAIMSSNPAFAKAFAIRDPFDYRGVREYAPTDDLRFVHWMCSARRGELIVKVLEHYGMAPCMLSLIAPDGAETNSAWDDEPLLEHMIRFMATLAISLNNAGCNVNALTGAWEVRMRGKRSGDAIMLLERLARLTYREASLLINIGSSFNRFHPIGFAIFLVTCSAVSDALEKLSRICGAQTRASGGIIVHFCACNSDEHSPTLAETHHVKYFAVRSSNELLPTLKACLSSVLMVRGVHGHV